VPVKSLIVISLLLILIIPIGIVIYYFQPIVVKGVVDHKTLVGVKNGNAKTLLMITPYGIIINDESVKSYVSGGDILYEELIRNISRYYDEVYCTISIRVSTNDPLNNLGPGETLAYIADAKYFSLLDIGSKVEFVITRLDPLKISRVISVEK